MPEDEVAPKRLAPRSTVTCQCCTRASDGALTSQCSRCVSAQKQWDAAFDYVLEGRAGWSAEQWRQFSIR